MKNIISTLAAGLIGGLMVLLGMQWMAPDKSEPSSNENVFQAMPAVHYVNHTTPSISSELMNTLDFSEAAKIAMPAVVHIRAKSNGVASTGDQSMEGYTNPFKFFFGEGGLEEFNYPRAGSGSGVIYTADGYIITNNHVVEFADEIEVTLFDNRKFEAEIVGRDPKSDLAVIKIDEEDLPILKMSNSDEAQVGQWVLAVGNPFELTSTVTAGIISAKGRNIRLLGGGDAIESFIQTDAAVNPGNSGGALVDKYGNLLGINTAIASRTGAFSGYSFAIPVQLAQRVVDDIIEYGSYQRPYLGVEILELNGDYAEELGVNISQGVVVENLMDGGSAQYAGIQPKDIIVKAGGKEIKSVAELQEVVGRAQVGSVMELTINRRGKEMDFSVQLKAQKSQE
jgi:serine protease Do